MRTAIGGQFGWGGTLLKRYEKCDLAKSYARLYISRAQRLAQAGQKSAVERKGKSQPDRILNNKGFWKEI